MSFASAALAPAPETTLCAAQVAKPRAATSTAVKRIALTVPPSLQEREKHCAIACGGRLPGRTIPPTLALAIADPFPDESIHAISNPSRHRPQCLPGVLGHHDLGRAEQRSRGPPTAGLCPRARHQLHRYRGDVSGTAERKNPGPHRDISRQLALATASRWIGHRHQGRRAGTPRLDPRG